MTAVSPAAACALGRHMTVEFYDCNAGVLADTKRMEEVFLTAAKRAGATVIASYFHDFEPQGVSGVVIISESHFAVHAWPEHDYAAVDLFTCGDGVDFYRAIDELKTGMGSGQWCISSMMHRGIVGNNGVERIVPATKDGDSRFVLSWKERFDTGPARGISAAIDIYECRELDEAVIVSFVEALVSNSGFSGGEKVLFSEAKPGWISFEAPFRFGRVTGNFDRESRTMLLHIFANDFFEPRLAAEFSVRELGGRFYRMMPHVRQ